MTSGNETLGLLCAIHLIFSTPHIFQVSQQLCSLAVQIECSVNRGSQKVEIAILHERKIAFGHKGDVTVWHLLGQSNGSKHVVANNCSLPLASTCDPTGNAIALHNNMSANHILVRCQTSKNTRCDISNLFPKCNLPPMVETVHVSPQICELQRNLLTRSVKENQSWHVLQRLWTSALQLQNWRKWCLWPQQHGQEFNSSPQSQCSNIGKMHSPWERHNKSSKPQCNNTSMKSKS